MRWDEETASSSSPSRLSGDPDLASDLVEKLLSLPAGPVYWIIGLLVAAENIFPPLPADTVVVLGVFVSSAGRVSAVSVFLVTWFASVGGAAAVYYGARTVGRDFFKGRIGRRLLRPKLMRKLEHMYAKWGVWGIFLSRFVPGARAVISPFAGVAGLGVAKSMIPVGVASAIWYGLLTFVAANVVQEIDALQALVRGANRTGLIIAGGVVVLAVGAFLLRRRLGVGHDCTVK